MTVHCARSPMTLGKCLWVLAVQVPNFEGGRLHREEMLKWFNYPAQGLTLDVKLAARRPNRLASSLHPFMLRWGQADSGESCIVLQSGPTCSLVAKFSQHSVVTCSTRISCCTLWTRPRRVCANIWCLMSWCPKCIKNNRSYNVSSADLPLDSLCKNLAWCMVTQRTLEDHKTVKIGGWAFAQVWALARDNTVLM